MNTKDSPEANLRASPEGGEAHGRAEQWTRMLAPGAYSLQQLR